MHIAIIADTHDHLEATAQLREQLKGKIDVLLHCGDFCAPFMMAELDQFGVPVHCVFGNIDDRHLTTKKAAETEHVTLHGDLAELEFDGKRLAMNHYPHIAKALAFMNRYDLVCFGHTHKRLDEWVNDTRLLNPGEIMGRLGTRTYAIYDTETGDVSIHELDGTDEHQ